MNCSAACGKPYIPERRFESIQIMHDPYNSPYLSAPNGHDKGAAVPPPASRRAGAKDVDILAMLLLTLALIFIFHYMY